MKIEQIRQDLLHIYIESNARGLQQSAKWATEILYSIENQTQIKSKCLEHVDTFPELKDPKENFSKNIYDYKYLFAKSIFDAGEYVRAAYFTRDSLNSSSELRFIHYYSKYLAIEKQRLDQMIEPTTIVPNYLHQSFIQLKNDLEKLFDQNEDAKNDAYMLYLYSIVLLKFGLENEASSTLLKSIFLDPTCWCSWLQLTQIVKSDYQVMTIHLPNHWIKYFFFAASYVELQSNEEALAIYSDLLRTFENNYIKSQMAILNNNLRYFDISCKLFASVRSSDPYKLDTMDVYSNLLYVREMQTELSSLAHISNRIDPFRIETCICIANFYSLRGQHAKSVVYFSRALQLNPKYLSAWTLMGHEYIELKNTNAAIQAYRSAIKCNKRDYRAWYGLGQAYEILKMPTYSLYYYSKAHYLKPTDIRFILAIGTTYEKMSRYDDAANCYSKAGFPSLIKLANLYERMNEEHKAAVIFNEFVNNFEAKKSMFNLSISDLSYSYKYLAFYFFKHKRYKESQSAAQICMYFNEFRNEIKELLGRLENIQTQSE